MPDNSGFAPVLRARLAGAVRQHPVLSIALALQLTTAVALGVVWHTKIRHSGDLDDYRDLLVDDAGAPDRATVKVTSLGTTMMLVDDGTTQILIDAFITPAALLDAALGRPVSTDRSAVDAALDRVGADRVRAIFISHSHHDHALDVAYIAARTGATVHGSPSTLNIARGGNVPEERLALLDPENPVEVGNFTVRTIVSKHSPNPMGGEGATIDRPLPQPARISAYKEGGTYDFLVAAPETSILFKGSANWIPGALTGVHADALFLGIGGLGRAGQRFSEGFLDATIGAVQPALVVPTHWNDFFCPAHEGLPLQRKLIDNTPAAFDTVLARAKADGVDVRLLDAFSSITVP
ncbi:MBL fold metallo-hydrolase [Streptomyces sp. NPDC047082]